MDPTYYQDLYASACVVGSDTVLTGRLDTSVLGITSTADQAKTVTGLVVSTANTGYLVIRLAGQTIATLDMLSVSGLKEMIPLGIKVPVGQTLSFYAHSTSGTAAASVTAQYTVGSGT